MLFKAFFLAGTPFLQQRHLRSVQANNENLIHMHAHSLAHTCMHTLSLALSPHTHTHTHTYTQTLTPKHTHTLSLSTHTRAHTCVHACTVPLPNYWSRRVYDRFRYLSQAQRKALHSMAAVQR